MSDYPIKISRKKDGTYVWSCPIEAKYHRDSIRPGLYACIGIAAFLLLFGGFLSYNYSEYAFGYTKDTTNEDYREKYKRLYNGLSDRELVIRDKGVHRDAGEKSLYP